MERDKKIQIWHSYNSSGTYRDIIDCVVGIAKYQYLEECHYRRFIEGYYPKAVIRKVEEIRFDFDEINIDVLYKECKKVELRMKNRGLSLNDAEVFGTSIESEEDIPMTKYGASTPKSKSVPKKADNQKPSKFSGSCFRCKEKGHRSNECPDKKNTCVRCGYKGHSEGYCRVKIFNDSEGVPKLKLEDKKSGLLLKINQDATQEQRLKRASNLLKLLMEQDQAKKDKSKEWRNKKKTDVGLVEGSEINLDDIERVLMNTIEDLSVEEQH